MDSEGAVNTVNPLRFCEQLYAVVVGLGLALAAGLVVDLSRSGVPVIWDRVPMFVAYLSIAFPYAHGAVRYIDLAYVERRLGPIPRARAITDVLLDGVRMWWLIALSLVISRPLVFGYVLVFLLLSGTGRSVIARVTHTATRSDLEVCLDRVNGALLIATLVIVVVAQVAFDGATEEAVARYGLLAAALIYPIAFYVTSARYFFDESPS